MLGIGDDPAVALVRHRHKVKEQDPVLGAELRVIVNALVFGIFGRFDEIRQGSDIGERPGPWSFLPIASSVTAGARLLLAVVNRLVADGGGIVAYRDTDSSVILSSPEGGSIDLADGSSAGCCRRRRSTTCWHSSPRSACSARTSRSGRRSRAAASDRSIRWPTGRSVMSSAHSARRDRRSRIGRRRISVGRTPTRRPWQVAQRTVKAGHGPSPPSARRSTIRSPGYVTLCMLFAPKRHGTSARHSPSPLSASCRSSRPKSSTLCLGLSGPGLGRHSSRRPGTICTAVRIKAPSSPSTRGTISSAGGTLPGST